MSVTDEHISSRSRRVPARAAARAGGRTRSDTAPPPAPSAADLRIDSDQVLPPGRRDASGFWIPEGYDEPEALFSPRQRSLQEKQRQAHRVRRQGGVNPGDDDLDEEGAARVDSPEPSD